MPDILCSRCGNWHRVMNLRYSILTDGVPTYVCKPCLEYIELAVAPPLEQNMVAALISLHIKRVEGHYENE